MVQRPLGVRIQLDVERVAPSTSPKVLGVSAEARWPCYLIGMRVGGCLVSPHADAELLCSAAAVYMRDSPWYEVGPRRWVGKSRLFGSLDVALSPQLALPPD